MARTKNNAEQRSVTPAMKVPRAELQRKESPPTTRPHRFRPGTSAHMEIRKWCFREPQKLIIRPQPFSPFVREIAQE